MRSSLSSTDVKASDQPVRGATGDNQDESVQSTAVVLSPVTDKHVGERLVDNVMGSSFSAYTMEMIFELDSAVVTFSNSEDQIKFLTKIKSSQALEKWQVTVWPLEAAVRIWVENLPLNVDEEILQLYFQRWTELNKKWMPKEIIIMPYQVAIITVGDPKVVKRICLHKEHTIRSASVRVYPYHESLRTPLYGKDRPVWKMPEPFIEAVEPLVWTFLESRKLWEVINDQMNQHFCSVNSEKPVVKLSPLPSFLKQAGLTADRVEKWKSTTQRIFHQLISQYRAFECSMNGPAWKEAEKYIRLVVREDANLQLDASSETLTVVGQVEDINKIEAHVKDIAARAMRQIQQKREEVTESMEVAPTLFYILEQEGLQEVTQDKWSDMKLSYNKSSKRLTFRGSTSNVYPAKLWVVEKKHQLIQKQIDVSAAVFNFLKMVDSEKMSEELFTSKGICATYSINNNRILLLGCSDNVLAGAEQKIRTVFNHQTLDVEDTEVLLLPEWMSLKQRLLGLKNSSKTTVAILDQGRDQVTVVGFLDPVKEVSREVKKFIVDNARLEETLPVQSCALQFIVKKKKQDYIGIADACGIQIQIEEERPSISIAGACYRVLKARSLIQEMIGALSTDKLIVDKPGAKKYFQFQGSLFLSAIMNDLNCVVLLSSGRGKNGLCLYKVTALSGVQVYVSEANICLLDVDAVVNAANEELKHIGGPALALLNAAGPELQKISNNYIARNGALRTGDTVVTDACNLPCKHVIHAVGPRFSEHSPEDSVSLLKLVVTRSLKEAEKLNCSTIAMPAISSGMFGFPIDLCADTIAQAVWEHCSAPGGQGSLREIQLVTNNDQTAGALAAAVKKVFDNPQGAVRRPGPAASRVQGGRGQSHSPTSAQRGRLKWTDGNPEGAGIHGNSGGQSSSDQAGVKGVIGTIKDAVTSIFEIVEDKPSTETLVLQKEEFEPAVFELCSENKKNVDQAKKRILELIQMEHMTWTIKDEYINQFTQTDIAELEGLQKQLSIKIHLKRGLDDQEPSIILEALTRDVLNANAVIRTLIQKTQCRENQKQKAAQMSERVEWQFQDQFGQKVPFNSLDNLILEEAFQKKEIVTLKINGELYQANTVQRRACSARSHKEIKLFRVDKKGVLPPHWEDMGDKFLKVVNLDPGSEEYLNVKQKATSSGRSLNILKIERIQNAVLWQGYQALKKSLEQKNGHSNNERLLFHGTKAQSVKFINKSGFNRSYAGMHGAMYGNGSYFAVDPNYSAQGYAMPDLLGHRRMYLAMVLVGDFTRGQAGLPAPPKKNPSDLYDSVTDNPAKPSMFVIFNDVQAYPEHLITFT
ncbi:protein mono-ADP-ribosyltransferase PARP14-like isoform X3 [Takifugu rubripes]|uniref:protein mono-ADP-ribosyltransferase PARP14-like isoform X3 n=1 Tax=Takifugu rubripes TaxID=31033 RepID=UPI001145F885|nr:protein mono-ADP-ribosyltransferase PARP14-like isoform X3 [Takifugu rubripes]